MDQCGPEPLIGNRGIVQTKVPLFGCCPVRFTEVSSGIHLLRGKNLTGMTDQWEHL